jgi:Ni/Co efflux regulator RcnB
MKRLMTAVAVLCVLAAPIASAAGRGKGPDGPPGLAGKPHGMPPGQVKKMWKKGERLPSVYVAPQYFITEPRAYRLAPPPPGHRWVVVDGDAYLVVTTNGLVAEVIAGAVAGLIR